MDSATLDRPARQVNPATAPAGDRQFPDNVWLNIPNVPVFAEHETTTRSGRVLRFGRRELQAVCSRCNRRITETGDYAGIAVGHTSETPGNAPAMPLVGLAGPFTIGRLPGTTRSAILCDLHVRREHSHLIRQYPRRSAELWVEDTYDQMYLDPIALLGAETPKLDMGLLYSGKRHQGGRPNRLTQSEIDSFVTLISRMDWAEWCKLRLREAKYVERCQGYSHVREQYQKRQSRQKYGRSSQADPEREQLDSLHRDLVREHAELEAARRPAVEQAFQAAKALAAKGVPNAYAAELAKRHLPELSPPPAPVA